MGKLLIKASLIFFAIWTSTAHSDVIMSPQVIKTWPKEAITVFAQRTAIIELGNFEEGEAVGVQVDIRNAVYKDLGAYIVDAPNMALARQNVRFRYLQGESKKIAPFRFMAKIDALGPYYLVLDNRFAAVINKQVEYQVAGVKRLTKEQSEAIREPLAKGYAALKATFQFKDFNIVVRSCGQSNAFSTAATGDVTLCTEMYEEMSASPGALTAVFLHELGHTLLNLWGHPSYSDEDVADQFALMMLLRTSGAQSRQAIAQWIGWFAKQDSRAQAGYMLTHGDTHSLSIQRIRNIQAYMKDGTDLNRRWNTILYPNMTEQALRGVIANPGAFDNVELAKTELVKRERMK